MIENTLMKLAKINVEKVELDKDSIIYQDIILYQMV